MTTDPIEQSPAGDRLFALIASIPGSGTVDWCSPARALLDEITAAPVAVPPTDRAGLRDRIAAALYRHEWPGKQVWEQALAMDREAFLAQADAVLALLFGPIPADTDTATWTAIRAIQLMNEAGRERGAVLPAPVGRAAVLREAATIVRSMDSDYALQEAAEHLDGLATEDDEEREAQAHLDALVPLAEGAPLPDLDGPALYEKLVGMFGGPLPWPPDSRPDLVTFRERIAEDLYAHDHPGWRVPMVESDAGPVYRERAVAVLDGLRRLAAEYAPAVTLPGKEA